MNDNDQFFKSGNTYATAWGQQLYNKNYIQDTKVLRCPSFIYKTSFTAGADVMAEELKQIYGAAHTSNADGFDFRGTKYLVTTKKVQSGTSTIDKDEPIAPNSLALGGCSGLAENNPLAHLDFKSGGKNGAPYGIHSKKVNIFFLDGHVEPFNRNEIQSKFYPDVQSNKGGAYPITNIEKLPKVAEIK